MEGMTVLLLNFRTLYWKLQAENKAEALALLCTGWQLGGQGVEDCEASFEHYAELHHYAGVGSGLDEQFLALIDFRNEYN